MFHLNNRGFAFSTILYGLLIMGIVIILLVMSTMQTNRSTNKEFGRTIEQELNNYSLTETEFRVDQNYRVPDGQAGWYKIELWSKKGEYQSFLVKLTASQTINFVVGATDTTVTFSTSIEKVNELTIRDISVEVGKARIKKILSDTVNKRDIPKLNEVADGTYYIMNANSNNQVLNKMLSTNESLESHTDEAVKDVNFASFTGEKNQKWILRTIQTKDSKTFYMIYNLGDDTTLQTDEYSDPTTSDIYVVAPHKFVDVYDENNNLTYGLKGWQQWYIKKSGTNDYNYIISGVFSDDYYKNHYPDFELVEPEETDSQTIKNQYQTYFNNFRVDEKYYTYLTFGKKDTASTGDDELLVKFKYDNAAGNTKIASQQFLFIRADY